MDRIGGPQHVRDGIVDALSQGIGVTAKVAWLPHSTRHDSYNPLRDDTLINTADPDNHHESRPRWIHCTPLKGSDSQPGVIMIVMVDKEEMSGTLHTRKGDPRHVQVPTHAEYTREGWPLRGAAGNGMREMRSNGNNLYSEYMKSSRSASQPPTGRLPVPRGEEGPRGISRLGMTSPTVRSERSTGSWPTPQRVSLGGREDY
jgi:hypothetical protein